MIEWARTNAVKLGGVMSDILIVKANYDPDAGVWYTESSDIHGLRIEAPSLEALIDRIPGAVQNLLEGEAGELDIPIEVIAHASTRLRVPQRA